MIKNTINLFLFSTLFSLIPQYSMILQSQHKKLLPYLPLQFQLKMILLFVAVTLLYGNTKYKW